MVGVVLVGDNVGPHVGAGAEQAVGQADGLGDHLDPGHGSRSWPPSCVHDEADCDLPR
jgi:hypothetical protein